MVAVSKGDNAARKRQHAYRENKANKVAPGNIVANQLSRGLFGGFGRGR